MASDIPQLGSADCFDMNITAKKLRAREICAKKVKANEVSATNIKGVNISGDNIKVENLFFNLQSHFWLVEDIRPRGEDGGSILSSIDSMTGFPVWSRRVLNTLQGTSPAVQLDVINSEIIMQPGVYFIQGRFPAYGVDAHKSRMVYAPTQNPIKYSANAFSSDNASSMTDSIIQILLTVTDTDSRYYFETVTSRPGFIDGGGLRTSDPPFNPPSQPIPPLFLLPDDVPEVYSTLTIFLIRNS